MGRVLNSERKRTSDIHDKGRPLNKSVRPSLVLRIGFLIFMIFTASIHCTAADTVKSNGSVQIGDDLSPRFVMDETYKNECGDCHIAYPPMLLPSKSWQKLMSGLEDHFGENAELDVKTVSTVLGYLDQHALETESGSIVPHWQEVIPDVPPIRITELQIFVDDHKEPYRLLGDSALEPGFFAPCSDCHKEAGDGIFNKDRLFRGSRGVFRRFSDVE
jgi:hypothetical protein